MKNMGTNGMRFNLRTVLYATTAICLFLAAQRALNGGPFGLGTIEAALFAVSLIAWVWFSRLSPVEPR